MMCKRATLAEGFGKTRECAQRKLVVLLGLEPADHHDRELAGLRSEQLAAALACVGRHRAERDAIRDHRDLAEWNPFGAGKPSAMACGECDKALGAVHEDGGGGALEAVHAEVGIVFRVHDMRHARGDRGEPAPILAVVHVRVDDVGPEAPHRSDHAREERRIRAAATRGVEDADAGADFRVRRFRRVDGERGDVVAAGRELREQAADEMLRAVA